MRQPRHPPSSITSFFIAAVVVVRIFLNLHVNGVFCLHFKAERTNEGRKADYDLGLVCVRIYLFSHNINTVKAISAVLMVLVVVVVVHSHRSEGNLI